MNIVAMAANIERILGLLHQNAILDLQQYDSGSQLTYARLRVFDSAARVPATPGGSETLGLIQVYEVRATYSGIGVATNYQLKRVL